MTHSIPRGGLGLGTTLPLIGKHGRIVRPAELLLNAAHAPKLATPAKGLPTVRSTEKKLEAPKAGLGCGTSAKERPATVVKRNAASARSLFRGIGAGLVGTAVLRRGPDVGGQLTSDEVDASWSAAMDRVAGRQSTVQVVADAERANRRMLANAAAAAEAQHQAPISAQRQAAANAQWDDWLRANGKL